jgi:hypothetical protein
MVAYTPKKTCTRPSRPSEFGQNRPRGTLIHTSRGGLSAPFYE